MKHKFSRYQETLSVLRTQDNERQLRNFQLEGNYALYQGKRYINLSSNDYLGITSSSCLQEFQESNHDASLGGTSSRLMTGHQQAHEDLELFLASIYQREAALTFSSGYHLNTGVLPALTTKDDIIFSDKLIHASMIDGIRLSKAKVIRYRHNDYDHLEELLKKYAPDADQVFIVTESIFSMDGDLADLPKLVQLKEKFGALLYVDEAHAVGVRGAQGLGLCEETDTIQGIDFLVGTFGKAWASQGAFIVCDEVIKQFLINRCRTFIYTTALPPLLIRWTHFVVEKSLQMHAERKRLQQISNKLADHLQLMKYPTSHDSHIVPCITYSNERSIQLATSLQKEGFFVLPIRPPTVPQNSARLRFSLNAQLPDADFERLLRCIPLNQTEQHETTLD